jgi:hypothetical protein
MRYTQLTWYEQIDELYKAHFGNFPLNTVFTYRLDEGWRQKATARRWTYSTRSHKTYQSALFNSLSNSVTPSQQIVAFANRI